MRTNAEQIAEVLGITSDDVAVTSLPLFYSYGMSVLNSHLLRGATVVLERTGIMQRDYWNAAADHGVTSMAFVPYQYEMLRAAAVRPGEVSRRCARSPRPAGGRAPTWSPTSPRGWRRSAAGCM